jgi:hypothetical protein
LEDLVATEVLHLLTVIEGRYKDAVAGDSSEIWVNTLRSRVKLGAYDGDTGALSPDFEVVAATLTDADTGWTGQSNWRLEGGIHDFDPLSYLVDFALPQWSAWQASTSTSTDSIITAIRLYPVGEDGHAIAPPGLGTAVPASIDFTAGYEPQGGGSSGLQPLQVSACVSHYTVGNGKHYRGRMFRAGLKPAATNSEGHFTSATQSDLLAKQTTLLEGLSASTADVSFFPIIAPNFKIGTTSHYGTFARISSVRVGSIPDTQRRRRNRLVETFVTDSVTAP